MWIDFLDIVSLEILHRSMQFSYSFRSQVLSWCNETRGLSWGARARFVLDRDIFTRYRICGASSLFITGFLLISLLKVYYYFTTKILRVTRSSRMLTLLCFSSLQLFRCKQFAGVKRFLIFIAPLSPYPISS